MNIIRPFLERNGDDGSNTTSKGGESSFSLGGIPLGAAVDDMIEIGAAAPIQRRKSDARKQKEGSYILHLARHNKLATAGILSILFGMLVVLGTNVCPSTFSFGPKAQGHSANATTQSSMSPSPTGFTPNEKLPSPQPSHGIPVATLAPPTLPPAPSSPPVYQVPTIPTMSPTGPPIYTSLWHRLSEVVSADLLLDSDTPQGMAYAWLLRIDDANVGGNSENVLQRFALATLYFATGGRRTSATWKTCSAVPNYTTGVKNSFSTRCIFAEGRTICAQKEEFVDCVTPTAQSSKRWLSETSECEWYGVSCNEDGYIEALELPENSLQGSLIPELVGEMLPKLVRLNLRSNQLEGGLPHTSQSSTRLQHVDLFNNSLSGTIPNSWYQWRDLDSLDLSYNSLNGTVNLKIDSWTRLHRLALSQNQLTWEQPARLGWLTQLENLEASGNTFMGELPASLGYLRHLKHLNLSDCDFVGTIPDDIASLSRLADLDLSGNRLNGTFPMGLRTLTNLKSLHLDNNQFSGTLPEYLGNLSQLRYLSLERSGLTGAIPGSLGDLTHLEHLSLQFNLMTGRIPKEVCNVTTLASLEADCDSGGVECRCCTRCCSLEKDRCTNP